MAVIAPQQVVQAGLITPVYAAVNAGGDKFIPGDNVWLHFKNTNAATRDVTVDSKVASNYGTDVNIVVTVPANTGDVMIGPFPAQRFMGADGMADISYSAAPGLTVAVIKI